MPREYRYQGITAQGKPIQGIIVANNGFAAKKSIGQLAAKYQFNVKQILPKRDWFYHVRFPNGKRIKGKQAAFTKEELLSALNNIGYTNVKIEPVLIDYKPKPNFQSILMFVNLSTFMLREKMSYDKILQMLAEEEPNETLRDTLRKIQSELKRGKEGAEVFARYEHIFGRFPAYMLGLATKSGNMAEVYEATSKFMERDADYRRSLRQALVSPAFTVLCTVLALLYYVMVIFPQTANLFVKFGVKIPPMTAATLKFSGFLQHNWWWLFVILFGPMITLWGWWTTKNGRVARDKLLINLPVLGPILHKSSIEIFFRVFSAIYSTAENNIDTLRSAAEACRNAYIEKGVKEVAIPLMLREGMALVPALARAGVFNKSTLSRLRSGSETGNILASSQQIYRFYEKETTYKMQVLIQSIQTWIGAFIGIAITLLTIVSSEIATVSSSSNAQGM